MRHPTDGSRIVFTSVTTEPFPSDQEQDKKRRDEGSRPDQQEPLIIFLHPERDEEKLNRQK